jgi:hypothetical protein
MKRRFLRVSQSDGQIQSLEVQNYDGCQELKKAIGNIPGLGEKLPTDVVKVLTGVTKLVSPELARYTEGMCALYSSFRGADAAILTSLFEAGIAQFDVGTTSYDLSNLEAAIQAFRDKEKNIRDISSAITSLGGGPDELEDLIQYARHAGIVTGPGSLAEMILYHENLGSILLSASNGIKMMQDTGGVDALKSVIAVYSLFSRDAEQTNELINLLNTPFFMGGDPYTALLQLADPSIGNPTPFLSNLFILAILGEDENALKIIELTQSMLGPALTQTMSDIMRVVLSNDLIKAMIDAGMQEIQLPFIQTQITMAGHWFGKHYDLSKENEAKRLFDLWFHMGHKWALQWSARATAKQIKIEASQKTSSNKHMNRIITSQQNEAGTAEVLDAAAISTSDFLQENAEAVGAAASFIDIINESLLSLDSHTVAAGYVEAILKQPQAFLNLLAKKLDQIDPSLKRLYDQCVQKGNCTEELMRVLKQTAQELTRMQSTFDTGSLYRDEEYFSGVQSIAGQLIRDLWATWFNKIKVLKFILITFHLKVLMN